MKSVMGFDGINCLDSSATASGICAMVFQEGVVCMSRSSPGLLPRTVVIEASSRAFFARARIFAIPVWKMIATRMIAALSTRVIIPAGEVRTESSVYKVASWIA